MTHKTYTDKSRPYTTMQKLLELEREIGMRERLYTARLSAGKMKIEDAARQLGILRTIAQDYRDLLTNRPLAHVEEDREEV
jgi:hypothetical protein